MIAPELVDEVRRLLEEGEISQRQIARRLGISRGSVCRIATGKRPDHEARPVGDGSLQRASPPRRCRRCGATVYMPCRHCRTRAAMAELPRPPILDWLIPLDEPFELQLKEEHRKRYEEIRARRATAEPLPTPDEPDDFFAPDDECELDPRQVLDAFELDDEPAWQDSIWEKAG